jgi:hypothetical protein
VSLSLAGRLRIVAHIPGRLRVRAEVFRDAAFAAGVVEQLGATDGITAVEAAQKTGSILIHYDAQRIQLPSIAQLIVKLAGLGGIEADRAEPQRPQGPALREILDRLNRIAIRSTHGRLDGKTAVPATLAGLGALTFLFGRRTMPQWYDLFFWSFVTFVNLNPPAPREDDSPR